MRRVFIGFLLVAVGIIVLDQVVKFSWALQSAMRSGKHSEILDFSPTSFAAKADVPFFYSIGNELKYSDEIRPDARTLLSGEIKKFLVAPDNRKIAVVANGTLQVVSNDGTIKREVARVRSIYGPRLIGVQFFRDDSFQWSGDSKSLYVIKDRYYMSGSSQLFSEYGQLWKYDIETGAFRLVVKPFAAHNYFFGSNAGIYFSVPDGTGNLQLKYFDGQSVRDVAKPGHGEIALDRLLPDTRKSLFFSFSIIDYWDAILPRKEVGSVRKADDIQELIIRNRSMLAIKSGQSFKGPFFCSNMLRSVFLPGDRYFLFNVEYCGNYQGQLLIDTATGAYMPLPKNTRVYLVSNTTTFHDYRITDSGLEAIRAPMSPVKAQDQMPSSQIAY